MDKKILVGVKEFAEISGLSDRKTRDLCKINGFPVIRVGQKLLIHAEQAGAWLAEYAKNNGRL